MDVDLVLENIGSFGKFQKLFLVFAWIITFFSTESVWINFTAFTPEFSCDKFNDSYDNQMNEFANISKSFNDSCYKVTNDIDMNQMEARNANFTVLKCVKWHYDTDVFSETITTKFDLVCSERKLIDFISSTAILGCIIGLIFGGPFSDNFGRKKGLAVFYSLKLLGNLISLVAPNVYIYIIGRIINRLGFVSSFSITCIFCAEVVGKKYVSSTGMSIASMQAIGFCCLPLIAHLSSDYKIFILCNTVPPSIFICLLVLFPESPRWLLLHEKYIDYDKAMHKIAKVNKKQYIPAEYLMVTEKTKTERFISVVAIFKNRDLLNKSIFLSACWFSCSTVFSAISVNLVAFVDLNLFLSAFLSGAIDLPMTFVSIYTMNLQKVGRRYTFIALFMTVGLSNFFIIPNIMRNNKMLSSAFSLIAKSAACAIFNGLFVFSSELYPTEIRSQGVTMCACIGQLGSVIAPYFGTSLMNMWPILPFIVFGSLSMISCIFIFLLPETLNTLLK